MRVPVFGTMPVGGFLGGVLGTWLGRVPALWTAVVVRFLAAVPVPLSPLVRMRELPDGADAGSPVVSRTGG